MRLTRTHPLVNHLIMTVHAQVYFPFCHPLQGREKDHLNIPKSCFSPEIGEGKACRLEAPIATSAKASGPLISFLLSFYASPNPCDMGKRLWRLESPPFILCKPFQAQGQSVAAGHAAFSC